METSDTQWTILNYLNLKKYWYRRRKKHILPGSCLHMKIKRFALKMKPICKMSNILTSIQAQSSIDITSGRVSSISVFITLQMSSALHTFLEGLSYLWGEGVQWPAAGGGKAWKHPSCSEVHFLQLDQDNKLLGQKRVKGLFKTYTRLIFFRGRMSNFIEEIKLGDITKRKLKAYTNITKYNTKNKRGWGMYKASNIL